MAHLLPVFDSFHSQTRSTNRFYPSLRVVRMHRAPRVRAFRRPPPAHPVASRRREARAPRGRAPCRHNSTSQQSPSCVSVSGFTTVGVRNPTGDRANFQSEFACASSVAFSLGTQRSPRRGRVRFVWFLIVGFPVYCAKKHSAVSDDTTIRGVGRLLFFLSSFSLTTVARSLASPYRA